MSNEADRLSAGRAAARIHIRDIRTLRSTFEFQGFAAEGGLSYDWEIHPEVQYVVGAAATLLTISYQLTVDTSESESESESRRVADLEFTLAVLGVLDEDKQAIDPLSEDEVAAWARTTGAFALYPFAREYVQNVTLRMGLPALTLDVMHLDLVSSPTSSGVTSSTIETTSAAD